MENTETLEVKEEPNKPSKAKKFFKWFKDNLMVTTNGMAIGLFGTLIIGTILDLFTKIPGLEGLSTLTTAIKGLMGAGIGLGVALAKKRNGVTVVAAMVAGMLGNYMFSWFGDSQFTISSISDPLSCYISVCLCLLAIKYIMRKKTPVDIILIPLVGIVAAIIYSFLLAYFVHFVTLGLAWIIEVSFDAVPFLMCIIISVLVGMALTAPISSVAICVAITIGNVPLAAVAAIIGTCTQMIGFAIHTAHDNKWGSVIAVGIGTSMLQFKNVLKKPVIWLPTIIASAILGPLAMLIPLDTLGEATASSMSVAAGMGTSGLVGPLNFFDSVNYDVTACLLLVLFAVVLPFILVFLLDLLFRKLGWIKKGDFSLQNDL